MASHGRPCQFATNSLHCGSALINTPSCRQPLTTSADLSSIPCFLTLPEEFLIRHDRLIGMRDFHVIDIRAVLGHAYHQPHALPEIAHRPGNAGNFIWHGWVPHVPGVASIGNSSNGASLAVGPPVPRARSTVWIPNISILISTSMNRAASDALT